MRYFLEFISALFGQGWSRIGLVVACLLGVGIAADYSIARHTLGAIGVNLPEQFNVLFIFMPLLVWLSVSLAHKETLRRLRAGRIVLDDPVIHPNVPLSVKINDPTQGKVRVQTGKNDIVYVIVRNKPHEMSDGIEIKKAYGSVAIFNLTGAVGQLIDGEEIIKFDYARWTYNDKPGYEGSPPDRYPDEWNFRTLEPNNSPNRLDLILKTRNEDKAFGFRGQSQLIHDWHDIRLALDPGRYVVRLSIMGTGMTEPYIAHYELINPGVGGELGIWRIDKGITTPWLRVSTTA